MACALQNCSARRMPQSCRGHATQVCRGHATQMPHRCARGMPHSACMMHVPFRHCTAALSVIWFLGGRLTPVKTQLGQPKQPILAMPSFVLLTSPGLKAVGMLPAELWHAPCRTVLHGACHSPAWGMPHTVPHRCARSMPQVYSEHGRGALLSLYSCTVCSLVPGREADPRENLGSDYPNSPSWECPLSFC